MPKRSEVGSGRVRMGLSRPRTPGPVKTGPEGAGRWAA